jgi:hypothetical protein
MASGQSHLTDTEALAANTVIPLQGNDGRQGGIYDTALPSIFKAPVTFACAIALAWRRTMKY